jgi:hypothetical protein
MKRLANPWSLLAFTAVAVFLAEGFVMLLLFFGSKHGYLAGLSPMSDRSRRASA